MKRITESPSTTLKQEQSWVTTRYMFRFDKNFLRKVNTDIHRIEEYGLAAANALLGSNPLDYEQRLKHFKLALKVYLKKVSTKLYVGIRHEFKHDTRASKIIEFETKVTQELGEIGSFLAEAQNVDWQEREALRTVFLSKLSELKNIYEREREFLHPIYLELDDNVVSFPQRRKTPLEI